MARWKPGPWTQLVHNFWESMTPGGKISRVVVGRDAIGNVYYEEKSKGNTTIRKPVSRCGKLFF